MCVLGLWGCGEDPQQLFETAQFEEQQGNRTHATQIYEQIIEMSPDSVLAQKAKERIAQLKEKNVQ
ncbi:MAG: lipoprotein [Nitrospirales bacterium]|nr:MAG: lipoprotein [Nitrospirales bacterium]